MTARAPRSSRGVALVASGVVALLLIVSALLVVRFAGSSSASTSAPDAALPAPPSPAFAIPEPRPLARSRNAARWSTVTRAVPVRDAPRADAGPIAFLATQTPERTANVVLVEDSAEDTTGRLWILVRVPALPENLTGWVPRAALGASEFVRTHLVVDLTRLTATLLSDGRPIFRAEIGIGKPAWPTPAGEFYVRSRIRSLSSFYGPLAFGTSARSEVLTDWPDGGFVGIHGTNEPGLLPGRVSHGCVRMRNEDILRLGTLMSVGTPVTIS